MPADRPTDRPTDRTDRPTDRTVVPRLLGAATLVYSLAAIARPRVIAGPVELLEPDRSVHPHVAAPVRAVSGRDVMTAVAMLTAPAGAPLRLATTLRALSDYTDALAFGLAAPAGRVRRKVVLVTAGWGTVNLLSRRLCG